MARKQAKVTSNRKASIHATKSDDHYGDRYLTMGARKRAKAKGIKDYKEAADSSFITSHDPEGKSKWRKTSSESGKKAKQHKKDSDKVFKTKPTKAWKKKQADKKRKKDNPSVLDSAVKALVKSYTSKK